MMNGKTYAIFLYDDSTQEFGVHPVEYVIGFQNCVKKAESSYNFYKICEVNRRGAVDRFALIHPVCDFLP